MNPPFKNKATPSEDKNMPSSSEHNFPVVGIGASAGGLDAFKQLLKTISVDSGMAYVLVQHLNPAHESNLTEILAQVTNIPIQEITDEVKILPNHIYVMPSGKILTSVDGVLKLSPRDTLKTSLVIDVFFTSLAVVWESKAVGVVLSGTGSDGTHGLKMIKDHGGITIVQDESAAYGDMPQSAVNANVVDFVLPPEKIAAHLLHINNIYSVTYALGEEAELPKDDEAVFKQMLNLLQQRSGVDFTYYKQSTVRRRIGRRMALHKRGKLADYLKFLRSDKAEQDALFQDMLIPVTAFFRDPKTFESLTEKVFPFLFKNNASSPVTISKGGGEPIRFWIAGCSTGEEAYSIAICLHEFLGKKITGQKIQIFASDISERAIKKARSGIYTKGEVAGISDARLNTYFVNTDGNYQVNATIRDLCVFANQNFLKDPPFAKMDMISCRNVLIYMNAFLQKKALTTFHYALKENGIMLLGKSETASAASQLFSPFDNHDKIYSRKSGTGRYMQVATGRKEETFTSKNFEAIRETPQADFLKRANAILMAKSPASVIVNEQTDIVHIHGDLTPYLQTPQGRPTHNLLRMAREGLAFELRSILHKSKTGNSLVIKEEILVKTGTRLNDEVGQGKQSLVTIEVIPLTDTVEPHFLILFTKIPSPDVEEKSNASSSGKKVKNEVALQRIEQLEKEVAQARHDLRSVTEDMDTANEELQSANEELQSSNEEMQSLNEELQTSKEELQSTVEELIIVNQELVDSVSEQARARKTIEISEAKFRNLILQAPVLISTFKGPSFIIETVNKIALEIWGKTHEQVINKPLFEVSPELEDGLNTILNNVYTTGEPFISNEINVQLKRTGKPNTAYFSSVYQPLRDLDNKICGIILIGTEVTESVNARRLIESSEQRLSDERMVLYNSFMNAPAGIAIYKGDTHIYEFANVEHEKTARRKITIGKTVQELFPELEQQGLMAMLNNVFLTGEPFIANELPIELKNEGNDKLVLGYYNLVVQPLVDAKGNTERLLSHAVDVTQQVEARKLTESSEQRFGAAVEAVQGILWSNNAKGEMEGEQKGWAALTGQSYQEYQGYGWAKAVHPDDAQPTIDAWNEAVREFKTFEFEHRVKTKSGKWELFSIKAIPLLNEDGSIREWIGVHTNITEQKEAEEKLKESEARFRTLTETIPIMVWTATPDGKKNFFNKYFLEYTGSTFEEAKGDGWQRNILPGDLEKELEIWRNSLKTGEDFKIEKRIRSHYGTYRWHLSHSMAQKDIAGKIIGWIGTNTDITEQKSFTEELEKKVKERTEQLQLQNQTFELAENIAQFGSYTWSIATGALEYSDNLFRLLDCEPQEFVPSFEKFLS
ncbi:MAG: PAS domain S-box protein, partial [Bacteroidota bacterium]|nr:PAS domain S-box protein [Bacteroidota bacterium]